MVTEEHVSRGDIFRSQLASVGVMRAGKPSVPLLHSTRNVMIMAVIMGKRRERNEA
jgi:hypothetical protein